MAAGRQLLNLPGVWMAGHQPYRAFCDCARPLTLSTHPLSSTLQHANVHFWDYTQPGYDALGLISCTGTNFLIRARAFAQVGGGVGVR